MLQGLGVDGMDGSPVQKGVEFDPSKPATAPGWVRPGGGVSKKAMMRCNRKAMKKS